MSRIELMTGFESTYQPSHDRDVMETTGHDERWARDLALVKAASIRRLRYPVKWHRVERSPGTFDWRHTDEVMAALDELGLEPVVDLVHHTSYPHWLRDGFADSGFPTAYLRYVEAFFHRYSDVTQYTLFNEPFATLFLCGHEAVWPPYRRGIHDFVEMMRNVLPAIVEAGVIARTLAPRAQHVWVDACEHHTGAGTSGERYAAMANDRRFFVLDAMRGMLTDDPNRPFVRDVLRAGGASLLDLPYCEVDVVGLDYYAHCQWHFDDSGGSAPTPHPIALADQIEQYARRYRLPVAITETNLRGTGSDRASWLKYVIEQCEIAVDRGVDVRSVCWFPFIDSADWDSLLYECEGNIDPVGVYWLDDDLERRPSSFTSSFLMASCGATAAELPAYHFQGPVARWLRGYERHTDHWDWRPPPQLERIDDAHHYDFELRGRHVA